MNNAEKRTYALTSEECKFVENLIANNEYIVRSVLRSALGEKFDQLGAECISDLYILLCEKIRFLKQHENPDGWMVVAAKNIALNAIRKHNTLINHAIAAEITDIRVEDNVFENALYSIWLNDGVIDKLLDKLTPHEREIYDYLYRERLTSKQVAEIMKTSDSTIRNINARIRKKIQKELNEKYF